MAEFKLVIGDPKTGKCFQREVKDNEAKAFLNKSIGENVAGDSFGLDGYEFEITGGSDYCGFPMRKDVFGASRKKIFSTKGVGIRITQKGLKVRKTVAGNTVHSNTAQVNLKVIKYGKAPLGEAKEIKDEGKKDFA
jgi:small subunit ribosomal protein S6e